jgi:hypothetical protein
MADEKFSLVDLILEARKQQPAPAAPAPEPQRPAKEPEIETTPKRWAMDPDVRADICGLVAGSRFEMSDCGEDLDGVWRVVQLNLAHPSPLERHLFAEREAGGPPYAKISEDAVREEMHDGRLRILPG